MLFLREKKGAHENEPLRNSIPAKEQATLWKGLGSLFTNLSFWVIIFYFAVSSLPGWGVKNWLPTLFAGKLPEFIAQIGRQHAHVHRAHGGPQQADWAWLAAKYGFSFS